MKPLGVYAQLFKSNVRISFPWGLLRYGSDPADANSYKELMRDLVGEYRGRVVGSPGDNVLAEFASVVDAVEGAVEIQQVLRAKNALLPETRKMDFRIGINLGDVIEEEDSIYGDGVNVAARLEGLAEAGGICISGSAYEQIENKIPLR